MVNDVVLIAHFCSDFDGKGNNRFNYIADLLASNNISIELITSDFSHEKKIKRNIMKSESFKYKITLISEPIYNKNVSIKRFYSHFIMGKNLKKYLHNRKKPDLIYCAVPSLNIAKVAAKYANKYKIKFIIDIQDIWPEAFKMIIKLPIINNIIFYPMLTTANFIYSKADQIIAVSNSYVERALKSNKKLIDGLCVYLGTELSNFDKYNDIEFIDKKKDEIWLVYIGTLGHSYDINSVVDALELLYKLDIFNLKFVVMGDGPLKSQFIQYAKNKSVDVYFTGRLPYFKMAGILKLCDIAVNPINSRSASSIINKVADYAAAGLPVLNTQECSEYRNLLNEYNAGYNCINNNSYDLAEKLLILYKDKNLRKKMGQNNRKLAEDKFDRQHTYNKILKIIKHELLSEGINGNTVN